MMSIRMTRTFQPVGEGAFCMETFQAEERKYHVIFDCGSSTRLNLRDGTSAFVIRETEAGLEPGESIEAVFISYFGREHMNGLEKLLKEHPVKRLFLPLLQPESRLFLSLIARIEFGNGSYDFVRKLIESPLDLLQEKTYQIEKIIFVDEVDEEAQDTDRHVFDLDLVDGVIASNSLLQCKFGDKQPRWKYVVANFREESRIQKLRKALLQKGLAVSGDETAACRLWNEHQREVIAVFMEDSLEGFHTNSLVVYSGKATKKMEVEVRPVQSGQNWGTCKSFFRIRSGCMYMEDCDAGRRVRWNRMKSIYRDEWDEISIWQLPHHGSSKYFNHELAVHAAEIYIACAGTGNPYQHPGRSVINKLQLTGKIVYLVNEEEDNRVTFLYEFVGSES